MVRHLQGPAHGAVINGKAPWASVTQSEFDELTAADCVIHPQGFLSCIQISIAAPLREAALFLLG